MKENSVPFPLGEEEIEFEFNEIDRQESDKQLWTVNTNIQKNSKYILAS